MQTILTDLSARIAPPDKDAMVAAAARQAALAKPVHALGVLEDISIRFAGITKSVFNTADKRRVIVFAADNGICEEGVASAPQSVTLAQTINISRYMTGVGVLAKHYATQVEVIDLGVNAEFSCPTVRNEKIALGTKNFAKGPAMTRAQALAAVQSGVDAVLRAKADGIEILGLGEMGIGNTSTSAAVLSALTGAPAEVTVSRGGGVNDAGFLRKKEVVDGAMAMLRPDRNDVLDVLCKVGGFDLCAMTGAYLCAAAQRIPVVIDGFISAVGALCAVRVCPTAAQYMFGSHISTEGGYALAMREVGVSPMLQLGMHLGEGSGCPIAFEIISAALSVLRNMATFEEAAIQDDYLDEIRENKTYQE